MDNSLVLLFIIIIACIGVRPSRCVDNGLSLEQSRIIKGLAAIFLVCVHIGNSLDNDGIYGVLSAGGYLLVSIFFFYSGYGIFLGLKSGGGNKYLIKHIWKLIKLMVVTEIVYIIIFAAYGRINITISNIILCISGWRMLAGQMWYIPALIIIYLGMLLLSLLIPKMTKRETLAAFGIFLYAAYALARGRQFHELQSCIAFLLGGLVSDSEKAKNTLLPRERGKRITHIIGGATLFIVANALIYLVRHIYMDLYAVRVLCGWISVASFICVVMNILAEVQLENRILTFVGTLFTWIYLSHQAIINILEWNWPNLFANRDCTVLSFGILIMTIAISYVIDRLFIVCKKAQNNVIKTGRHN